MPFLEDIRATTAKLNAAVAAAAVEHSAEVQQLSTALFTRVRPVPALIGIDDPLLQEACLAFSESIVKNATQ